MLSSIHDTALIYAMILINQQYHYQYYCYDYHYHHYYCIFIVMCLFVCVCFVCSDLRHFILPSMKKPCGRVLAANQGAPSL